MPSYTLEIQATGLYTNDIPMLEIWSDSFMDSSHNVSSTGSVISLSISFGGSSYDDIAILDSVTGLDLNVLVAGDNLIV